MGKAQRAKGATFERDVVNALKDAGIDAARNLDQTRDGGGDIDLGAYMVECKRRASIAVYDWLDQCTRAARPGQIPLVVARGDRREAVVILRLDDFIPMLGKETKECLGMAYRDKIIEIYNNTPMMRALDLKRKVKP